MVNLAVWSIFPCRISWNRIYYACNTGLLLFVPHSSLIPRILKCGILAYSFLDPQKQHGKVAAYIIGIAVGEIIIFCLVRGVIVLRERWAIRARHVMVGGPTDENVDDEEWEEIEGPSSPVV
jgi:hypothetical protein